MSEFVKSIQRLYKDRMVQDNYVEKLLENKKITLDEYLFIVGEKEV